MPIFRTEKVSDYAVIAKHHLKNKALSYKAKGLLTFMLSVPPEWDWSMAGLAILASDGIDGVRSGIRELEKHGYLTRRRIRDASGRLGDIEYTIHELPQNPQGGWPEPEPGGTAQARQPHPAAPASGLPILEKPTLEKPILENPTLENPTLEKPTQAFPTQVLPTQENPMQINNNQSSIEELSTKESSNKKHQRAGALCASPGSHGQMSLDDAAYPHQQAERLWVQTAQGTDDSVNHAMTLAERRFEDFWQLYPRKAGKKAAKKAWLRIKPDETLLSTIMAAVNTANRYWQQQGTLQKHIPHPSTWLNEERWEDEYQAGDPPSKPEMANNAGGGGDRSAAIGADYTIGGDNDPYRAIMPGQ